MKTNIAFSIAGSDSGGGAGIQADLKTFEAHGVFGATAITAITAQNTTGVQSIWPVPAEMIAAQIHSVLSDMPVKAIKTGMLYSAEIINTVSKSLFEFRLPLIVDPVMIATSGDSLFQTEALHALKQNLLPLALMVTPNIPEAEILSGMKIHSEEDMGKAAKMIAGDFPSLAILIKGGHLSSTEFNATDKMNDFLFFADQQFWIQGKRINTAHTHGTGCTLSAAITSNIALGYSVLDSVTRAKQYLNAALANAWDGTGKGAGTLRHNHTLIPVL